jgi:hypothetical protein
MLTLIGQTRILLDMTDGQTDETDERTDNPGFAPTYPWAFRG